MGIEGGRGTERRNVSGRGRRGERKGKAPLISHTPVSDF